MKNPNLFPMGRGSDFSYVVDGLQRRTNCSIIICPYSVTITVFLTKVES